MISKTDSAIQVRGLSKRYQLGLTHSGGLRRAWSRLRGRPTDDTDQEREFWALRDVSFDIDHGDVVGIIGKNGAGKSTLLKILSRITWPTHGEARIRGRIASLLEVGTGFHPELTGRENAFLNGAILGMGRSEVRRKMDEIIAFAGLERFIDTPVKRYSSGMYVRLAFAVAAHLEPEILLVDEVLAVGDAQFQKQCLDKMQSISTSGRTILFVSHNMSALRAICRQGIVLRNGAVELIAGIDDALDNYLSAEAVAQDAVTHNLPHFVVESVTVESRQSPVIKTFEDLLVRVQFRPKTDIRNPGVYVGFLSAQSERLAGLDARDFKALPSVKEGQLVTVDFEVAAAPLLAGNYRLELHLKDLTNHLVEILPVQIPFEVVESPVYSGRKLDQWFGSVGLQADVQFQLAN